MDAQVPAVVAVVVTTDPGPWLEEALASLAAQDYEELSVLVLSTGEDDPRVVERVARVLPDAFVRHLPGRPGYGPASNEALGMVEGAAFFLLCHDDVALDPDAVHKLVEESFRSNAGVVSPKFVNWDDPRILLHVGMSCDKTGAVVDRILEGEVDHGQHDAVRDVFVAPGGCILVRADLFAELKGFDPGIVAMGEDLDLSWRSQVAGSRVVVAPDARVRHREAVAGGSRPLAVAGEAAGRHPVTMQGLQRRHELRAVLKCYTRIHLVRVLPQAALLAFGETVVAMLARDRDRVRAVTGAWRWNARRLTEISLLRGELAEHRLFPDSEVRRLQVRGSARLSRYLSRLSHQGLNAANAVAGTGSGRSRRTTGGPRGCPHRERRVGLQRGRRLRRARRPGSAGGARPLRRRVRSAPLSTGRQRVMALVIALLVIALGTRELFFGTLPLVGQLAPLPSWSTSWHHFFSGWQSAGVGTTAPASPAFGLVGLTGTVLFGAMGTLQRVLLLGCIPLGAWGVSRCMRPLVSPRAARRRHLLPRDPVALRRARHRPMGRARGLCRVPLHRAAPGAGGRRGAVRAQTRAALAEPAGGPGGDPRRRHRGRGGLCPGPRAHGPGHRAGLGGGIAPRGPAEPTGRVSWRRSSRSSWRSPSCSPGWWARSWPGRARWPSSASPSRARRRRARGEVVRFAIGPVPRSPIAWLLVLGAALPLVIARGVRLASAARLWVTALGSWGLAFAATRGDLGSFTPSETVVLAPAALAVAACVGIGIAAFENDLSGRELGWRQLVSVVARPRRPRAAPGGGRCRRRSLGAPLPGGGAAAGLPRPSRHRGGARPVAR